MFEAYEDVKRGQGRMDMEDVLLLTAGLLAEDERVAARSAGSTSGSSSTSSRTSRRSSRRCSTSGWGAATRSCVVGDPGQTIYSFAGANARYLRDFPSKSPRHHLDRAGPQLPLDPEVVAAANTLLAGTAEPGRRAGRPAPSGPAVTYTASTDEVAEAEAVAAGSAALRDAGACRSEIAVLFRINAQSEAFEDALAAAASPTSSAARPASSTGPRSARRSPCCAARPGAAGGPATSSTTVRDALRHGLVATEAPTARGQTRDRWESLQALVDQAEEFAPAPGADLGAFVDDLDRRAAEQHAPVADGVTLATLHAAKGLEWDAVFLCGLQDGTLPITYAETPAAVEEERRLLYVGMTRARDRPVALVGAGPQPRRPAHPQAVAVPRPAAARRHAAPSRVPAPAQGGAAAAASAASRWRAAAEKKVGRCADCPASYDEELFERLREWRKGAGRRGRGAGVRRLHRRDPAADRRAQAHHAEGAAADQRDRPVQAREVRRRRARAGRLSPYANFFREMPIKSFAHYRGHALVFSSTPAHTDPGKSGARNPKEVARWNSITNTKTAPDPVASACPSSTLPP